MPIGVESVRRSTPWRHLLERYGPYTTCYTREAEPEKAPEHERTAEMDKSRGSRDFEMEM